MAQRKDTPGRSVGGPAGEILLYETEDGRTRVECRFSEQTLWMTQALMADLFQATKQNISLHLRNIFQERELQESAVVKEYLTTASDGKAYQVKHYNLDAILAVGYRVRSPRGTRFRQWATERLREYLVKGFTLDDERLKHPPVEGSGVPDYFDELLERIRDIRASEARMYLRVKEIFALAADYDPTRKDTTTFFQIMQNKLHYSVTRRTAAELIAARADHTQPNMGLTSWKGSRVLKSDVAVAKNYLAGEEIGELNRIVTMWLDFAEDQSRRRQQVFLKDWETKLNEFLRFTDRAVLDGAGGVSHQDAMKKAELEYEQFAEGRRALMEAQGEHDRIEALEETAKQLEEPKKPSNGKQGKKP